MGILGALFSGVSGLDVFGDAIEVIGNNIANSNTPGFKTSRAEFSDILARSLSGATSGNQIGRGVQISSVTQLFSQGSFQSTSGGTDLAIDGAGFFIVQNNDGTFFTRAGNFRVDASGILVNTRGDRVQGVTLDISGNPSSTLGDLNLTVTNSPPKKTDTVTFVANLDASESKLGSAGTATSGGSVTDRFQFLTGVNDVIEWNDGVANRTASLITDGGLVSSQLASGAQVATAIKTALEATNAGGAAADTYTVSYSITTRQFSITNDTGNAGGAITLRHTAATSTASDDLGFATAADDTVALGASALSDNQVQFNVVSGRNTFTVSVDNDFYQSAKTATVTPGGYTADELAKAIEDAINTSDDSDPLDRFRAIRATYNAGANTNKFQILSQTTGAARSINAPSDSNIVNIPASAIKVTEGNLGVLGIANLSETDTFAFVPGVNEDIIVDFGAGDVTVDLITDGLLTGGKVHTATEVAAALKTALDAKDGTGGTYTVSFNTTTKFFSITSDVNANTNLRWSAAGSTVAATLGFATVDSGALGAGGTDTSDVNTDLTARTALNVDGAGGFVVSDPSALTSSNFSTSLTLFDSLGSPHSLNIFFRKIGENIWEYNGLMLGRELQGPTLANSNEQVLYGRLWFQPNGALDIEDNFKGPTNPDGSVNTADLNGFLFPKLNRFNFEGGATQDQLINFDFGTSITSDSAPQGGFDGITQFAGASAIINQNQDGFTTGTLQAVSVNRNGNITGQFTNGQTRDLARIILGNFNAPDRLSGQGNSLFGETQGSGQPVLGQATTSGFGSILANSIELSNVDIAEEFVLLIQDQQAFQANARMISTTRELLSEIVNLTR